MGIDQWIFKVTKSQYGSGGDGCFLKDGVTPERLRRRQHVALEECQHLIKVKPDGVRTLRQYLQYFFGHIKRRMRSLEMPCPHFTVLLDRWSHELKQHHVHGDRDKGVVPYEYDELRCVIDERRLDDEQQEPFQSDQNWKRYTSNRELVRRELYPIIFNAFISGDYITLENDEQLIVHGLPGRWDQRYESAFDEVGKPVLVRHPRVTPDMERRDPDIYKRVFCANATHYYHWKEASSDTGEADLAIVQYWRFFSNADHVVFMNDGDALPILLLHAFDRLGVSGNTFDDRQFWLCKPRKRVSTKEQRRRKRHEKPQNTWTGDDWADERAMEKILEKHGFTKTWDELEASRPKHVFIDINKLFLKICSDPRLEKKVQNPVLFYVSAIILSGTDYFGIGKQSFLPGLGVQKKIWPTLFENAADFSHMVQASMRQTPNQDHWHKVIIDYDAMVAFCKLCYVVCNPGTTGATSGSGFVPLEQLNPMLDSVQASYAAREEKRKTTLKSRIAKLRDGGEIEKLQQKVDTPNAQNFVLSEGAMRVVGANLKFNLEYWWNAMRPGYEHSPNPRQKNAQGLPLYGYNDDNTIAQDAGQEDEVDETFSNNFFVNQKKQIQFKRNKIEKKIAASRKGATLKKMK